MTSYRRTAGVILLLLALAAVFVAVFVGLLYTDRDPVYLTKLPAPDSTVITFFNGICSEDYETAYACLDEYATLGLENKPDEAYAARLWNLVRSNTSWRPVTDFTITGTHASLIIELTYPDVSAITADMNDDVNRKLTERVDPTQPSETYYDENGEYLPELIREIYDEVFNERISASPLPTRTDRLTVNLEYADFAWKILPDEALLAALRGTES